MDPSGTTRMKEKWWEREKIYRRGGGCRELQEACASEEGSSRSEERANEGKESTAGKWTVERVGWYPFEPRGQQEPAPQRLRGEGEKTHAWGESNWIIVRSKNRMVGEQTRKTKGKRGGVP